MILRQKELRVAQIARTEKDHLNQDYNKKDDKKLYLIHLFLA